ncbi:MAG: hypothetical protein IJ423_05620 [Clostridia bacterium]|nr:hypothetical protein [Clostridia bacterium]MBQ8637449.1 hypothetical protein [Clostridia bacterium]
MARGKKTSPEVVYQIMTSWAVTHNYKETADFLGLPVSTVKKIVDEHIQEEKYEKLCNEKEQAFSKKADGIINKALARLERDIENEDKDIPVNHLTTVIGTLTDKKLLLEGKPTENTKITFDLPPEVKQYAE